MKTEPDIVISDDLWLCCEQYAERAVAGFKEGRFPRSQGLALDGKELDHAHWTKAKAGECAFAEFSKQNPMAVIDFSGDPDGGNDLTAYGRMKWDVKTIEDYKSYLCWPAPKTAFYLDADFHALALVKARTSDQMLTRRFWVDGWITKAAFYCEHQVATGEQPRGLYRGTWWMHQERLWAMDSLLDLRGVAA